MKTYTVDDRATGRAIAHDATAAEAAEHAPNGERSAALALIVALDLGESITLGPIRVTRTR